MGYERNINGRRFGLGDPDQLTIGILNKMRGASALYLRTKEHPAVQVLNEFEVAFESFDEVYETKESFPEVYEEITSQLITTAAKAADGSEIVYVVPTTLWWQKQRCSCLRSVVLRKGLN